MIPLAEGISFPIELDGPAGQLLAFIESCLWLFLSGFVVGAATGYVSHLALDAVTCKRSLPLIKKGFSFRKGAQAKHSPCGMGLMLGFGLRAGCEEATVRALPPLIRVRGRLGLMEFEADSSLLYSVLEEKGKRRCLPLYVVTTGILSEGSENGRNHGGE